MGVLAGATFCAPLSSGSSNGYDAKKMIPVQRIDAASDVDPRARWSQVIQEIKGQLTVLQVNRDGRGNLQHHLRLKADPTAWSGSIIFKASYVTTKGGHPVDHIFVMGLDNTTGCVLSTSSAWPTYNIDWAYQLIGHKLVKRSMGKSLLKGQVDSYYRRRSQ